MCVVCRAAGACDAWRNVNAAHRTETWGCHSCLITPPCSIYTKRAWVRIALYALRALCGKVYIYDESRRGFFLMCESEKGSLHYLYLGARVIYKWYSSSRVWVVWELCFFSVLALGFKLISSHQSLLVWKTADKVCKLGRTFNIARSCCKNICQCLNSMTWNYTCIYKAFATKGIEKSWSVATFLANLDKEIIFL
jgi:hypothetical protein